MDEGFGIVFWIVGVIRVNNDELMYIFFFSSFDGFDGVVLVNVDSFGSGCMIIGFCCENNSFNFIIGIVEIFF